MIIMSQGLMLDGSHGRGVGARDARGRGARQRQRADVLPGVGSASQSRMSETLSQDRDLREAGLETLAARSRGSLFRVVTNPEYVFERLRNELSGYYMLGVEPLERDRDGRSASDSRAGGPEERAGAVAAAGAVHEADARTTGRATW